MSTMTEEEIEEKLVADLTKEFSEDPMFDKNILQSKIEDALNDVKIARNYPDYYTDNWINVDMTKMYSIIKRIARAYYNRTGDEHVSSSSENGLSQSYLDDDKLFTGIIPLARF